MIDTVFYNDSTPIRVSHDQCSDPVGRSDDGLLVNSKHREADTLTKIAIGEYGNTRNICLFWPTVTTAEHFDLLYLPSTETLFIGGGTVSAGIDLETMMS